MDGIPGVADADRERLDEVFASVAVVERARAEEQRHRRVDRGAMPVVPGDAQSGVRQLPRAVARHRQLQRPDRCGTGMFEQRAPAGRGRASTRFSARAMSVGAMSVPARPIRSSTLASGGVFRSKGRNVARQRRSLGELVIDVVAGAVARPPIGQPGATARTGSAPSSGRRPWSWTRSTPAAAGMWPPARTPIPAPGDRGRRCCFPGRHGRCRRPRSATGCRASGW